MNNFFEISMIGLIMTIMLAQFINFFIPLNNNLLILTSTAKDVNNFDKTEIDGIISEAEKKIGNSETSDKEKYILSYKISTLKNLN